jgi:septal ring factor EnvC (AmiA/AmiB activator)
VSKVEAGSALVNQSGQTLQEIVGSVKRVTDIIAEIAAAAAEQSSGIDQVNRAVTQMERTVQSNASQTAELSSTAHHLAAHAQQLQTLVARFKLAEPAAAPPRRVSQPAMPAAARPAAPAPVPVAAARPPKPMVASVFPTNGQGATNGHGDDGFEEF